MSRAHPGLRLSIIIPARNEQTQIGALLDDLAALRRNGHQVLLVDGGSEDATVSIAAPLVDDVLGCEAERARQMNRGASEACGDILWFLHADTRVPASAPAALITAIEGGAVWGRFDVRLSGRHRALRIIERLMNLRSCMQRIATGDQGIFVRRDTFEEVGGFPQIPLMEDIALSKLLRRRARPACLRQPRLLTSSRRWEQHGILRTVLLMWRLRLAYALGASPVDLARLYR